MSDTTDKVVDPRRVTLQNVRGSFYALIEPKASVPNGPKKFGANFILDPDTAQGKANIAKCEAAILEAEKREFKGKTGIIEKVLKKDIKRVCFREGDSFTNKQDEVYVGYEGMYGLATKSKKRPKLLTRTKQLVEVDDIGDIFLAGMDVDAIVSFYCTSKDEQGGNGLFCTVELIRARGTGEAFGSAGVSDDDIDGLEELPDDDGMDDDLDSAVSAAEEEF